MAHHSQVLVLDLSGEGKWLLGKRDRIEVLGDAGVLGSRHSTVLFLRGCHLSSLFSKFSKGLGSALDCVNLCSMVVKNQ